MNWKSLITGIVTIYGLNSGTTPAQVHDTSEYIPLNVGDWYSYGYADPCPPDTVRRTIYPYGWESRTRDSLSIEGKKYYVNDLFFLPPDTLQVDEVGNLLRRNYGADEIFFKLSAAVEDTWHVVIKIPDGLPLSYVATMQSRNDTIKAPAGEFVDCLRIHFNDPRAIDDEITFWLAPHVGNVFTCAQIRTRLHAAVVGGVEYPKPTFVQRGESAVRSKFSLFQNYPNPFNPTTVIQYSLPDPTHVSLKLYDLLGRMVLTVVDEFVQAGSHTTRVDATELASGLYIYRLQTGASTLMKKMLVVK